jgi:hypothetical protein
MLFHAKARSENLHSVFKCLGQERVKDVMKRCKMHVRCEDNIFQHLTLNN